MRKVLAVAAVALFCAAPAATASAGSGSRELQDAVTTRGILVHDGVLQAIGLVANGNRLAGAPGHDASALYVGARAAAAGLKVSTEPFDYDLDFLADYKQPILRVVSGGAHRSFNPGIAGATGAEFGGDFGSEYASQSTDITAPVWAIDLKIPPGPDPNGNTSGCELEDYAGMPAGAIALVQRGTCSFAQKFLTADAAGVGGMVLFNEGQPGRTAPPPWFDITGIKTPTFGATFETGAALANGVQNGDTGLRARFRLDWRPGTYGTKNVIAETRSGDPDHVIVVGAHLDSVGTGSGINDNGSGSAMNLEIAEQIARLKLRNKVRFVWFSAEESGLLGSEAYVAGLSDAERAQIAAMLNFDMVASPNFARFVYDGDLSDSEPPPGGAPPGSADIEDIFLDYFAGRGLANEPTPFDGRSDYGPFIAVGIPAGGLFTGAEEIKTPEQVALYGGTAGLPFDICYHQGCDNLLNLNRRALDEMSDAAAHATITLAQATTLPPRGAAEPSVQALSLRDGLPAGVPRPVRPDGN
ncbi:MAG TPA: M28 family peptidase [Thermoleophilaceae bacterium]